MGKINICYGCGLPVEGVRKHYHDGACRDANTAKRNRERRAVVRSQGAALNGGTSLGKWNKDLAARLAPLVLRSHGEVAKMMGLSAEGVRLIELRALAKIRAALLPFKNATCGADKVRVVTCPIPSL